MSQSAEKDAPQKWRKKPVQIEAMRYDGTPETAEAVCRWVKAGGQHATHDHVVCGNYHGLWIDTLEGQMAAGVGDWIIRGVQGEFYPCKPDIFEATYERVLPPGGAAE